MGPRLQAASSDPALEDLQRGTPETGLRLCDRRRICSRNRRRTRSSAVVAVAVVAVVMVVVAVAVAVEAVVVVVEVLVKSSPSYS